MKSRPAWVLLVAAALLVLTACDGGNGGDTDTTDSSPAPTATKTKAPDLSEDESGPESPIAYGLYVPAGATQLGPLFRYRSSRLLAAYKPELDAALAQKAAEDADKVAQDEANGTPAPTPTPTPTTLPSPDSFKIIEDPPRPDTSISLMRIDGDPTEVVLRMLAQIDAAIPTADLELELDDLTPYCTAQDRRITQCRVEARGLTEGNREIRVTMEVDAGNLATRTAPPAAMTRPVMRVTAEYVGDPRAGQLGRDTGSLDNVADVDVDAEKSGLIWPKMDLDADTSTPLVNGFVAPPEATVLLSGYAPQFVAMATERATLADQIAAQFVTTNARPGGTMTKDVVEDLNSVSTMYSARTKDGSLARAVYILSARGNYTALFYTPPES